MCWIYRVFHITKINNETIVIGVDNLNNYYDRSYKIERLKVLNKYKKFVFYKVDINNI